MNSSVHTNPHSCCRVSLRECTTVPRWPTFNHVKRVNCEIMHDLRYIAQELRTLMEVRQPDPWRHQGMSFIRGHQLHYPELPFSRDITVNFLNI